MVNIPELYGSMVFNDSVMREMLPQDTYRALRKTAECGTHLELDVANVVANAMKDWAVEKGVTHFTHWFQPMTGVTAEKHDSFITPDGKGRVIMEFSGKSLVKGEPDASSFPSGGLRATFEARGYTVWDTTSYAFIKDNVLCIPTAFCSFNGAALDKKTPLLRSMEAIDKQAVRILRLFGNTEVKRVLSEAGSEQEYFLVDKEVYLKRPDLIHCGRTLLGARPPKGQEMDDHYFGAIKRRVSAFMNELDTELWKLGVPAKTKHNETAPAQHELALVYAQTNVATDHNQITMELMKSIAVRHGMVCLLHEKPFAGVNGSGKHNNWSLSTDTGVNLLEPGATPHENAQFLLFLCAVIQAADEYSDLLRASVATAGNDHRLGGSEAPPAIVSVFLGSELTGLLDAIETGSLYAGTDDAQMEIGVTVLPHIPKDTTDRNRTSPFAFTGNKFEFRMPGSSLSIADPNLVINTIVADVLSRFADELEQCSDFQAGLSALIRRSIRDHKRVVFNGNGYDEAWPAEAERRGLANLKTTPETLPVLLTEKNTGVFIRNHVLNEHEIRSRYEVLLENYSKTIHIEALTMIDMTSKYVIPAVLAYQQELAGLAVSKKKASPGIHTALETNLLKKLAHLADVMDNRLTALNEAVAGVRGITGSLECAKAYRERVVSAMSALRNAADELELLIAAKHWKLPSYSEILYSVL